MQFRFLVDTLCLLLLLRTRLTQAYKHITFIIQEKLNVGDGGHVSFE